MKVVLLKSGRIASAGLYIELLAMFEVQPWKELFRALRVSYYLLGFIFFISADDLHQALEWTVMEVYHDYRVYSKLL